MAVVLTGCDSGLGYNFAKTCKNLNFVVYACVLDEFSKGAVLLRNEKCKVFKMDLRSSIDIETVVSEISEDIRQNSLELKAVVNNAGVMSMGHLAWLTDSIIKETVDVNFLGPVRIIKAFLPLLRKSKGRIINITSHCALQPLPGLTVYSASKRALSSFSEALNYELDHLGVKVIEFIPGGYVGRSAILDRQNAAAKEMEQSVPTIDKNLFSRYMNYLREIPQSDCLEISEPALYKKFQSTLIDENPKNIYINNNLLRYLFYYTAFRLVPGRNRFKKYLIKKFIRMPT